MTNTKNLLAVSALTLALAACGGDSQEHSTPAGGNASNAAESAVVGSIEFEGERHDLVWSSCANRPESGYLRWLADGEEVVFQFQRYERQRDEQEHRYTMRFTMPGKGTWENVFRQRPTITITEEAVEGEGMVYPRDTPHREIDEAMVPIRFEFRCR